MTLKVTLKGLEAFEAAARLGGIGPAAEELGVTASAISHRIRTLEGQLGVRLFARGARGLVATREGKALAQGLEPAFRRIAQSISDLVGEAAGPLRFNALETFALYWLMPRLGQAAGIEIAIESGQALVSFDRDNVDAALRLGHGSWDGLEADHLFAERVALLARPGSGTPRRLFLSRHRAEDWAAWRDRFGGADLDSLPIAWVDSSALAIKAASDGAGTALASVPLTRSEVAAGRLALAHPGILTSGRGGYWLVYRRLSLRDPRLRAFRNWILAEAAAEPERESP